MGSYQEYDPAVLRKLQLAELQILADVAELCKINDIPWFALGGCCIGAFRHGGFIPWDDDIDICMLRADYDRFIETAKQDSAFSEKYKLIIPGEDKTCSCMFTKVSKKGTKNMTEELLEAGCEVGIHLDLFPFDNAPSDPERRKKQARRAWMYSKLSYIYHLKRPHLPFGGFAGKIAAFGCRVLHEILRPFPALPTYFAKKYLEVCSLYNSEPTEWITDFTYIRTEDATMRLDEVFPLRCVPFENTQIFVPQEYDKILRQYYGDYMQLPPEEKRKNHPPAQLEF